jgi:hypothetical protein
VLHILEGNNILLEERQCEIDFILRMTIVMSFKIQTKQIKA